jgi:hypothetical protein
MTEASPTPSVPMRVAPQLKPLLAPIERPHSVPASVRQHGERNDNAFELTDEGFPQGPTHGYHARVWGFVIELILERSAPIQLGEDGRLQQSDAKYFAKRSVWPPRMMHGAFGHMVRRGYVRTICANGQTIATVDLAQLIEDLRLEHRFERQNPTETARYEALRYFRSRQFSAHMPWLDELLREVDRDDQPATNHAEGEA